MRLLDAERIGVKLSEEFQLAPGAVHRRDHHASPRGEVLQHLMNPVVDEAADGLATGCDTLQAVLFDMDGLLVDTEPIWFEVERSVMARLGGDWTGADQQALVGGSLKRSVGYLISRSARPEQAPGFDVVARLAGRGDG